MHPTSLSEFTSPCVALPRAPRREKPAKSRKRTRKERTPDDGGASEPEDFGAAEAAAALAAAAAEVKAEAEAEVKAEAEAEEDAVVPDEDLLSDEEGLDLGAFGDDVAGFLRAPTLEVLRKTTKIVRPTRSFAVNSYYAAHTQANKLETKGFADADPEALDAVYRKKYKVMAKTGHRFREAALDALRMMKRADVAPDKRMEAEMSRIRESSGEDGAAYVELNNYCQRLQREKEETEEREGAAKKHAQTLTTLVVWRLKAEFAEGEFDFDSRDPMVTVDAAFVEALVRDPPKAPRKRKLEVRGPRPSGKKAPCAEESTDMASADEGGSPPPV